MEAEGDGGLKIDEDGAGPSGADDLPPVGTPVRKNGFFCMTNQHHKVRVVCGIRLETSLQASPMPFCVVYNRSLGT